MRARNEIAARMDECVQLRGEADAANTEIALATNEYLRLAPAAATARSQADSAKALGATNQTVLEQAAIGLEQKRDAALNAMTSAIGARAKVEAARAPEVKGNTNPATKTSTDIASPYCQFYGGLPGAIEYANTLREDYYSAVGDQSKLKSGLALSIIPISAAAIYFGVTGGNADVITGLATAGAAGLGLGAFMLSDGRQQAYLSGSMTLGCAIARSAPYLIRSTDYYALRTSVSGLSGDRATLVTSVNSLRALLAQYSGADQLSIEVKSAAEAALNGADPVMTAADGASSSGATAISKIEGAGPALYGVTDDIRDKVSVEILKTEPDISAIAAIANGLSPATKGLISSFAPAPQATPAAKPADVPKGHNFLALAAKAGDKQVTDATEKVNVAVTPVQERVFQIAPYVSRMHDMEAQLGALSDCPFKKLDNAGFSIDPSTPDVSMKVGGTYSIQVTGAIGNVTGQVIGNGDPAGLTSATAGSGTGLRLTLTASKVGVYQVSIADASGKNAKILNISVTAAAKMTIDPAGPVTITLAAPTATLTVKGVDSISFPVVTTGDSAGLDIKVTPSAVDQKISVTAKTKGAYEVTITDGTKQQSVKVAINVTG